MAKWETTSKFFRTSQLGFAVKNSQMRQAKIFAADIQAKSLFAEERTCFCHIEKGT